MKKYPIFVGIVLLASIGFSAAAIVYNVFAHNYVSKPACYGETWSATTPRWGFYWCHSYGNVETYIGAALGIAAAQIGLTITFMVACLIFRNNMVKRHQAYTCYIIFLIIVSFGLVAVVVFPALDFSSDWIFGGAYTEIRWGWGASIASVGANMVTIATLVYHRRSEK